MSTLLFCNSVEADCKKRPVSLRNLERQTNEILNHFISRGPNGKVEDPNVVVEVLKGIGLGATDTELRGKKRMLEVDIPKPATTVLEIRARVSDSSN